MHKTQTPRPAKHALVYDPIHQVMQLPPELKGPINKIIDTSSFQRLRGIRQMGLADFVFPSATHTRFLHALGACYLAYRIGTLVELDTEHLHMAAFAGLLHDIGHGPLSHAFETYLQQALGYPVRHEQWTGHFLRAGAENHGWLSEHSHCIEPLIAMITGSGKGSGQQRLVADIISSQLDADRLDYLLRDSHFCGVSYGSVDLEWLLYTLVPVETDEGLRLGITDKGVGAAEEFFMARRLMYRNVYHHKKIIAFERVMVEFFSRLAISLVDSPAATRAAISAPLADFLKDIDSFRERSAEEFRTAKFTAYSQLRDYDLWLAVRSVARSNNFDPVLSELANALENHGEPIMFRIANDAYEYLSQPVQEFKEELGTHAWKVGLHHVEFETHSREGDHPVISSRGLGHARQLGNLSDVISLLGDRVEPVSYLRVDGQLYAQPNWKRRIDALLETTEIFT